MDDYNGTLAPPGGLYVRAMYDYRADDQTSLSFQQGDIIQVITQLESGWWDGVLRNTRGWFPSNYCAVVPRPNEDGTVPDADDGVGGGGSVGGTSFRDGDGADMDAEESQDDYENGDYEDEEFDGAGNARDDDNDSELPIEGAADKKQDQTAFWIPQATPDGRLFYFNTLTGESTMELPLETPSSADSGPRDRTNIYIPDQSRPPPELMAGGYERDEEDTDFENSASEAEGQPIVIGSRGLGSMASRRRSFISDSLSPATSMDSMHNIASGSGAGAGTSMSMRSRGVDTASSSFSTNQNIGPPLSGTTMASFINDPLSQPLPPTISRKFFDDANAVPLTWNRLMEDMRRSVERYRQAINNSDRAEFVKRAEDISDHLRLILSAASGTTDNHSGNPSIISTNKVLYPHFRETMSRFSKLVLSSHIAAADWPPQDSYSKCLKEADGVLNGVHDFIDVARQQRGEDIPRLMPGFVAGSHTGGNWQNNGLTITDPTTSMLSIEQDDYEPYVDPTEKLDTKMLERLEELRGSIQTAIRRLNEHLVVRERLVTPAQQQVVATNVYKAAGKVFEWYRPWIHQVESINLAPLGSGFQNPTIADYSAHKQKAYDLVADLLVACQSVGSALADEWADYRGESLEDRLGHIKAVSDQLQSTTSQLYFSLELLEQMPTVNSTSQQREENRRTDGGASYETHLRTGSKQLGGQRPILGDMAQSHSYSEGVDPVEANFRNGENSKVKRFFGEVPMQVMNQTPAVEETPEFLKLDHEGEIAYDHKRNPPDLKGGTLTGLVEQLTRHDKLDSGFNGTFLLTYRSFTTANELFEMLMRRWSIQPPQGLATRDYETWVEKKQKIIRFRVVNILKSWVTDYWMEGNDEEARQLIQRIYNFVSDHVAKSSTPGAGPLLVAIEQRSKGHETSAKRMVLTINSQNVPQPILPKHMKKLKFLDFDTTEFARQLTVIESRLYGKIRPTECLNKTWQKKLAPGEPDPASNVKAVILHSNQLTNWVAQMILTQNDAKRRVAVIKHFVSVADKCRNLNNFSTLTSIISAFGTAPIHRLNRTWNLVNARTMSTLESMRKLMGSTKNFAEYRDTLHKANPPCIPFFGVYLTDLTFIEDGIPSTIKKSNLINFAKRAKTAEVIRDIQQYQNVPYPLHAVGELQDYILTNMQSAADVHEMYEMSLAVEPREREDEKIAR
ncbi:cell division control protein-like protein Cdc25 [Lineolata rhizophorae]|uniref:Class E vacuolar protein-sorting machinery protein HSE1 n=1 Tax=Lineolata rhizophorae TaxID=578093 RepID=A0A6A6NLL2_9PEZI|nr:cell division control protein-like protein Cdc25 [Lineolata rhizophorae]